MSCVSATSIGRVSGLVFSLSRAGSFLLPPSSFFITCPHPPFFLHLLVIVLLLNLTIVSMFSAATDTILSPTTASTSPEGVFSVDEIRCNRKWNDELVDEDVPVISKVSYKHPEFTLDPSQTRFYAVERCHYKEDVDVPDNRHKECTRISQWYSYCTGSCVREGFDFWNYQGHVSLNIFGASGDALQIELTHTQDQFDDVDFHPDLQPILYFQLVAKPRDGRRVDQSVVGEWHVRERMLAECRGEVESMTTSTMVEATTMTNTETRTTPTTSALETAKIESLTTSDTTKISKTTEGS